MFCDGVIEDDTYLCNNFAQVMRTHPNIALPRYVFYFMWFLHYLGRTDLMQNKTTGIRNLQLKMYLNQEIPLPSLSKQQRSANILDQVTDLISLRKQQLAKLDELVKSRFIEMFGEPVCNSKNLPTERGVNFFKLSNGKFVPESRRLEIGIPAYGGNGISWYTDDAIMKKDTLVVGRVGFQSGNVHFAKGPLWITDNAMYISDYNKEKFDLFFLYSLMRHIDFTRFQDAGDLKK